VGQVVRCVLLLGMAAITYWAIGTAAAAALVIEATIVGVLAIVAFVSARRTGDRATGPSI
jgi:hypothetical protein